MQLTLVLQLLPFAICGYQQPYLHASQEQAYLLMHNEFYYLAVMLEVPGPVPWIASEEIVDVDMGIRGADTLSADGESAANAPATLIKSGL